MALKDHLVSILDVFSRRSAPRGLAFTPDVVSETLRNRILLLYRETLSGKWGQHPWSRPSDCTREFGEQIAQSLQHLYGRPKLSDLRTNSVADGRLRLCLPV
jgi:hypothetical protein